MLDTVDAELARIEAAQQTAEPGFVSSSLELLQLVYRNPAVPLSVRMRAAVEALPFEHPKLSATAILGGGDFADRLDQAIARSNAARIIDHCPTARE
jgi:hypothetical protein